MRAVILCGGPGTCICDASEILPKPLLPVGGMPIVWHILKGHAVHGVHDFVLCLGYKGWLIKEIFLDDGRVREFNEKPQVTEGAVSGGFFVLDAERITDLAGGPGVALAREPLRRLAREGELVAYPHPGYWQPMDTAREYALLNDLWSSGHAPWKTW